MSGALPEHPPKTKLPPIAITICSQRSITSILIRNAAADSSPERCSSHNVFLHNEVAEQNATGNCRSDKTCASRSAVIRMTAVRESAPAYLASSNTAS
jgi:hypothetical protein